MKRYSIMSRVSVLRAELTLAIYLATIDWFVQTRYNTFVDIMR